MSASDRAPRGIKVPWGLLGMIGMVLAVEGFVTRRAIDFMSPTSAYFAYPSRTYAKARRAEILCLGDSLVKVGLVPRALEAHLARRVYNLAVAGATPPATYLVLRHALEEGVRPTALVVDFHESNMCQDPAVQVPCLAEIADLRDCVELAWTWHDARVFELLAVAWVLPSFRSRSEIRAGVLAAFRGEANPTRRQVRAQLRNWQANQGAHIFPQTWAIDSNVPFWDEQAHLLPNWRCHARNGVFLIKFLKLAAARDIPVYWLIPPIRPRLQAERNRLGLDEVYTQFVRRAMDRFPNLVVIDGRSAGFAGALFADSAHVNRQGALTLSAGVAKVLARSANRPRWVNLPEVETVADDVAIEDYTQSDLAVSTLPEGRR